MVWTWTLDNTHGIDLDSWYRIGSPESPTYEKAECCPYARFSFASRFLKNDLGPPHLYKAAFKFWQKKLTKFHFQCNLAWQAQIYLHKWCLKKMFYVFSTIQQKAGGYTEDIQN